MGEKRGEKAQLYTKNSIFGRSISDSSPLRALSIFETYSDHSARQKKEMDQTKTSQTDHIHLISVFFVLFGFPAFQD